MLSGVVAQLFRAPPLQGGGPGLESLLLHHDFETLSSSSSPDGCFLLFGLYKPTKNHPKSDDFEE